MTDQSSPTMIEARGLTKYFDKFIAIEDITFSIPKGQIVAFLGPNGAGKSTTLRILSGFLGASSGSACIAGLDTRKDRLEASRKLGYLPENGPGSRESHWVLQVGMNAAEPCIRLSYLQFMSVRSALTAYGVRASLRARRHGLCIETGPATLPV